MIEVRLTLPESLHRQAEIIADREGVAIDQLVVIALAEKISALMTEEYLRERAERGSRQKFDRVLAKVPPGDSDAGDAPDA